MDVQIVQGLSAAAPLPLKILYVGQCGVKISGTGIFMNHGRFAVCGLRFCG
jgi:hypothetical protein